MDTFLNLISGVQSDLNINDSSEQFTPTTVKLAVNRAYRKIGGLFKWPQLEDAKKTNSVASQEYYDYPDTWRPNSIWKLQVDGTTNDYGDPLAFKDYLYEKDNSLPSGLQYIWANYFKRYYIYPILTTNGSDNIVIWGREFVETLTADGDETIFSYAMPECNEAIVMEAVAILKYKGEDKNSNDLLSPGALQTLTKSYKELRAEMSKQEKTQSFFETPDYFSGVNERTDKIGNFVTNMAQIINGIKAPAGGFQQGGWYSGRQYWNGTLSEPGQINTQSNQPGAGGMVSNEVIAQTNPANVAYVAQQRQQAQLPASPATGVPASPAPQPVAQPTATPAGAAGTGTDAISGFNQPKIDLPALYQGMYESSGVKDLTERVTTAEKQFLEAKAKISDNPFLDASTIDKRLQRLQNTYDIQTKPLNDQIAFKNTDIQMKLKLQTDQFSINSEQAQLALTQFQTLLASGAFDNADANSIINVANATGLSTSMIQSAIGVSKEKNKPKLNTQVITFDDGTNQGYAVVNQDTGEIINKQVIGTSKPDKATGGGAATKEAEKTQNSANLTQSVKNGITLKSLINAFSGALSIEEIYRIYNQYSPHGQAKETLAEVKQGKFTI